MQKAHNYLKNDGKFQLEYKNINSDELWKHVKSEQF